MPAPNRATRATARRRRVAGSGRSASPYSATASNTRSTTARRPAAANRRGTALDLASQLRSAERTLRQRVSSREALLDIVRAVSATLEPAEIAAAVIERLATWLPGAEWTLYSADLSGQLSLLAPGTRTSDPEAAAVAQWMMQSGQAFASVNLAADDRFPGAALASVFAFPLSNRGTTTAAIVATAARASSREPRVPPAVLRGLQTLLEPAAGALDKALLLKRAEALSVTDDLTRLYNSRYLNQVLRRETKRSARGGRPLSLLFIDLDGFKSINDTHGHLQGSRALVEAGAIIRGGARETDIVARFGGDEFALVLPDTGAPGAVAVAERVRERIATHTFLASEGLTVHLTASVGIATLPDAASTADGLVQAADAAMYQVKAKGKNGIQTAPLATDK